MHLLVSTCDWHNQPKKNCLSTLGLAPPTLSATHVSSETLLNVSHAFQSKAVAFSGKIMHATWRLIVTFAVLHAQRGSVCCVSADFCMHCQRRSDRS